jgi:MFS family permease
MTRIRRISTTTFAALSVVNYRHYIAGQAISLIGTWMQMTAMSWLVLTLTHSATIVGLIVAAQTLPVLVLAPYGGVIADRVDKRRLMISLQILMGVQALILGVLTVTGEVQVWQIAVLALMLGFNNAFENPSRQSFMLELVGPEHLRNAVSLNSTLVNVARVIGPGIGGLLIATVGSGVCFLINAGSFVAVVASLLTLDTTLLNPAPPLVRARGQLREGLNYVRRTPGLALPLVMMAAVGCLTYEFQVSLPYMASNGLHSGSSGYGFMTAAMGLGAVAGGLVVATRGKTGTRALVLSAIGFGIAMTLATVAPTLALELIVLMLVGASSVSFMSMGNATLQLRSDPAMRGRVMALWFVSFQGSTPIGGPAIGAVMSAFGPRAGLGVGAVTCFVVAAAGALAARMIRSSRMDEADSLDPPEPLPVVDLDSPARPHLPDPSSPALPADTPRVPSGAGASRGTTAVAAHASAPTARDSVLAVTRGHRGRR